MEKSCIWNIKPVEQGKKFPKSWEEFCEMFPGIDVNLLPDRATCEAVQSLCQLIWLRNAYNGDWMPDWNKSIDKIVIDFCRDGDLRTFYAQGEVTLLAFKDKETADEFLRNFRPLIEKLKPLYGIREGGGE